MKFNISKNDKLERYIAYEWMIDVLNLTLSSSSEHLHILTEEYQTQDTYGAISEHIEAQIDILRSKRDKLALHPKVAPHVQAMQQEAESED